MTATPIALCHPVGFSRRELLQIGFSGLLGLGLPSLLAGRDRAATGTPRDSKSAKSVILIFLTGAPSHIDTFDVKPEAPMEVRGTFKPISTRISGMQVCEHLPMLAARANL